jgi:hypothetical protein
VVGERPAEGAGDVREPGAVLVLVFWAIVAVLALMMVNLLRGERGLVTTGLLILLGIRVAVRLLLVEDP